MGERQETREQGPHRLKIALGTVVVACIAVAGAAIWGLRPTWPAKPPLPGKVERGELEHGGRRRVWMAYVPAKPQSHPTLVIVLHASMGSGQGARQAFGYDFDLLAEQHGFIAVYPDGYEGHWNDCKLKGPFSAKTENIDDVGFLHAMIQRLVKDHGADRAHVYVTGISNGGAMAIRLALQTPEFARAYAAVVSSVPTPENLAITPRGSPVSILLMDGTADPMVPWDGGNVALYGLWGNRGPVLSVPASVDYFLQLDALHGPPITQQIPDLDAGDGSTAERQSWTAPGKPRVVLIKVQGGGHSVPHPATYGRRLLGKTNRDFHAAREIWDFFQHTP